MYILQQLYGSLSIFFGQAVLFILKLLVAYTIWLIGKYLIDLAVKALSKIDIKRWDFDDKIREKVINISVFASKIALILVILDYLGIGRSLISALSQGLSFTIAITLGISFGEALKPEAKKIVEKIKEKSGNNNSD